MTETADIVIIGAGIVGCSIAYHLAVQGAGSVVVVEKDLICSGATGKSAGGIRQQFATELNIHLSIESLKMFHRMREELGVDPEFRRKMIMADDRLVIRAITETIARIVEQHR